MGLRVWSLGVAIATSFLSPVGFLLAQSQGRPWSMGLPGLSQTQPEPPASAPASPLTREAPSRSRVDAILKPGSRGEAVARLQQALWRLGYYAGPVDGQYGAATAQAVVAFQSQYSQPADGLVRASTWSTLQWVREARILAARNSLVAVQPPTFSTLTPTPRTEPPSPIWLLVMPLLPLLGGGLTYAVRRAQSKDPFSGSPQVSKPPEQSSRTD